MSSSKQLFTGHTAFFSPVLPSAWKQLWLAHGGAITSEAKVKRWEPIHYFFGSHGVEDPLVTK